MRIKPLPGETVTTEDSAKKAAGKAGKKKSGSMPFKKSKKLSVRKLIVIVLLLAVLGGGGFGIYRLFFYSEPVEIKTGETKRDSITTVITGTATVQPTKFQDLTIPVDGTVKEVYVKQGDKVEVGDPLYAIDTSNLTEDIASVESNIAGYETQLATYQENLGNLTVSAPFSGKLIETTSALAGDTVNAGTKIATVVDDSKMKLSLYFSKAYETLIRKGMTADVSVPQYMTTLKGTVTSLQNVSYVSAEGTVCFKATISVDNPGSLTEGLTATATVTADGQEIAPADSGTFEYNQARDITTKVSGTLSSLNVEDSLNVSSGETLAVISNDTYTNQVTMLEKQIKSANLNLQELQEELADCAPAATVAGTVIFVRIEAGDEVNSGTTAMAIYNTDSMKIVADISESDNDYIEEGMTVTITKGTSTSAAAAAASAAPSASIASAAASSSSFTGIITKKSLEATASNGVAYFETTITIESNGLLSPGIYVTYTITAAQASDVVLAPVAAIQKTTAGTCLFIKSDTKPTDTVELAEGVIPDGYYAVKVETGLTSNDYVEITSGVNEGVTVFERYIKQNTTTGSDKTSESSDNATQQQQGQGQWSGGPPGGFGGGGGPMGG
jgi:multidrug efflux pump subunit AcrA (membrane-fusion protein)